MPARDTSGFTETSTSFILRSPAERRNQVTLHDNIGPTMQLADFHYHLPQELIAQYPPRERGQSRLLVLEGSNGALQDRQFRDLPDLLVPGDLLVFNDTRVIPARLHGHKETGGRIEILIERILAAQLALAHIRASRRPRNGSRIILGDGSRLKVLGREGDLYKLEALDLDIQSLMDDQGSIPLPPYITRVAEHLDLERYQTVYADRPGAIAAPTAGLHFDQAILDALSQRGIDQARVTLHVGAGTFQPVRAERLEEHVMHSEWLEVSEETCKKIEATRERGRRVIAVGTTSVRSLETASHSRALRPYRGETRLFIRPGFQFCTVDAMITNFHLPESTLLMLVAAFSGWRQVMVAYQHAVSERYRFFSYGDAMLLTRNDTE